jgi:polysaccharide pyruvyl transferase WcaK-like protein
VTAKVIVLHVASFHGNIGDNANHAGFRTWFSQLVGGPIEWREFEIRDVYRKTRAFDAAFAEEANAADLVVIGGGNYFELWVADSPTGTSISIPDEVMDAIRTPVFINALGVDDAQGFTEETLGRFRRFLSRLLGSRQYLVSVRNDGALGALRRHAPGLPIERVIHLPDGGFFSSYRASAKTAELRVGVNLAGDMLDQRFPGGAKLDFRGFLSEMAEVISRLQDGRPGLNVTFFPHIFRDLAVCADLLSVLPDQLRRDRVRVAAYDSGEDAAQEAFGEYLACDVVLAMRFHSNVVPIGHGIPTIGLHCYDQISRLYEELNFPEGVVSVNVPGFAALLLDRVNAILDDPRRARSRMAAPVALVKGQRANAAIAVGEWLRQSSLS